MRQRAIEPIEDTWQSRYLRGEHEAVWAEMIAIGPAIVNDTATLRAAEAVAVETMRRVRLNLELIHARLHAAGFAFAANCDQDWPHRPLQPPAPEAHEQLHHIETAIGGQYLRDVIADGGLPGWRRTSGDRPPPILQDLTAELVRF